MRRLQIASSGLSGALIAIVFLASGKVSAGPDNLLIERNSRPLLAEGSMEALGPWETPLEGFFVRSHHNVLPAKVDDSWVISFEGLLSKSAKIKLRDLKKRKQVSFHAVLECSGNGRALFSPQVSGIQWKRGAVGNAEWTGVRFADVIKDLGVKPEAVYVTAEGFDEPVMQSDAKFVRSIPVKMLIDTGAILAFQMNRQPVPVAHGGPVRLVIPGIYGQNWIKWLNRLIFSKEPDHRMYAKKAYRMPDKPVKPGEAWDPVKNGKPVEYIKVQTIITSPLNGQAVTPGKITVRGKAFSGAGSVAKVEVSIDGGKNWQLAKLGPAKDYAWQEFEQEIEIKEGKSLEVFARATDTKGNVQPLTQEWNPKGYLYNAVDRITLRGDAKAAVLAEGESLASQHCLTCHSIGIAAGQRLELGEWKKTVRKMADYGLVLSDEDADKIAGFFAAKYPPGTPVDDSVRIELAANPSSLTVGAHDAGNAGRGSKLFSQHCAVCHVGSKEVRRIGPMLKGRMITDATFWSTVVNGKRTMPPFKDVLSTKEISDIRAWLRGA